MKQSTQTVTGEGNAPRRRRRTRRQIRMDAAIQFQALERILSKPLTTEERIHFENRLAQAEAKL